MTGITVTRHFMDNLQNEDNKNLKEIDTLEFAHVQKIFLRCLTTSSAVTLFSSVDTYNTKKKKKNACFMFVQQRSMF